MKVESWRIENVHPYPNNPRRMSDKAIEGVAKSIGEYGFRQPVVVDGSGVVVVGHTRLAAAKSLGLDEVPVHVADLTPDQARAYRLADNRTGENTTWDNGLLADELRALDDFDLDLTGFGGSEISRLLGVLDEDETPEPSPDPITQPGDLWILGRHRLICGDSTDAATVARVLDGQKPVLMVTDPPYGVEYDADWRNRSLRASGEPYGGGRAVGKVLNDDRADWFDAWTLSPANVVYCWSTPGANFVDHVAALLRSGFEQRSNIIWVKSTFPIGRGHYHSKHETCVYGVRKGAAAGWIGDRKQTTVWEIERRRKHETGHSTQKPIECMERPIRNHEGDVYEPFAGSGTTVIAAERQNRRCFAIELNPSYCDVIVERWQNQTGEQAERANED